jgi:peptidoglycan/xylan/chitin deacetylase (PgdA/CDA1 family)
MVRWAATVAACAWVSIVGPPALAGAPKPAIAITFDDIPAHGELPPGETRASVMRAIVAALKNAKAPAHGFLNASFGADDPHAAEAVRIWREARLPVGNHGFAHRNLDTLDAAGFRDELVRNEPAVASANFGVSGRWFRYPFLAEGSTSLLRDQARAILAERGYRIAAVTMSFGDFLFAAPYARCATKRDAAGIAALERAWLDAARADALRAQRLSEALLGRDIPQVLLMHVGAFDARMLPRTLKLYRDLGFRFVTLEQAQSDRFYAAANDPRQPGPSPTLERAATAALVAPPPAPNIQDLCQ